MQALEGTQRNAFMPGIIQYESQAKCAPNGGLSALCPAWFMLMDEGKFRKVNVD